MVPPWLQLPRLAYDLPMHRMVPMWPTCISRAEWLAAWCLDSACLSDPRASLSKTNTTVKHTPTCTHTHTTHPVLQGTLGGDIAELATAIVVYLKSVGAPTSGDVAAPVKEIFNAFMAQIATKERPFYFHTSDEKLNKIFSGLAEEYGVSPKPTAFPKV